MYAQKHDASGILMTAWGDNGNHWAWPVMFPSLTLAAALAWNRMGSLRLDTTKAVDLIWFRDGGVASGILMDYLATDALIAKTVRNKSVLWEILFNPRDRRKAALEGVTALELEKVRTHLKALAKRLVDADPKRERKFTKEMISGVNLSLTAVARGIRELTTRDEPALRSFGFLISEYEAAWLLRARKGGLAESVGHLAKARGDIR